MSTRMLYAHAIAELTQTEERKRKQSLPERVADDQEGDVGVRGLAQHLVGALLHHLAVGDRDLLPVQLLLRGGKQRGVSDGIESATRAFARTGGGRPRDARGWRAPRGRGRGRGGRPWRSGGRRRAPAP